MKSCDDGPLLRMFTDYSEEDGLIEIDQTTAHKLMDFVKYLLWSNPKFDYRLQFDIRSIRIYYSDPRIESRIFSDFSLGNRDILAVIREHHSPRNQDHVQKMQQLSDASKNMIKKRVVSRPNPYPFRIELNNLDQLMSERNLMEMIDEYSNQGILLVSRRFREVQALKGTPEAWRIRYARTGFRVADEGTATLLAFAMDRKYVRSIVQELPDPNAQTSQSP